MNDSTIIVKIAASGPHNSGKSTLMAIIRKAIADAEYPVSEIRSIGGQETKEEIIFVTTQKTRTEWTTKLPSQKES